MTTISTSRNEAAQSLSERAGSAGSSTPSANPRLLRWALPAIAFCITVGISFLYRPLSQPERGDPAIYDYIAQTILRGGMPYRDVIDPKGPGAMYVSAAAMWIGRRLGIEDVLAVRYVYILVVGVLSVLTVLVAERYLSSRLAGLLAFLIPLVPSRYLLMMVAGTEPKLVMMVFGMLALVLISRDRPFWAGFSSMLACLCWQPGLMFAGIAFLIYSKYLTSWRDLRAIKVVAGTVVPLVAAAGYFQVRGALPDLWNWAFTYDYSMFMPAGLRGGGQAFHQIVTVMRERVFYEGFIFVEMALAGFAMFAYERVRGKRQFRAALESPDLYKDALLMPPVIYFGFCMLNFQSSPDTIPFFPFIGLFAAWLLVKGAMALAALRPIQPLAERARVAILIPAIALALVGAAVLRHAAVYRVDARTLADQYEEARIIDSHLSPGDKIYVHGTAEVLTLLNKPNLNPYIAFDSGSDDYIASHRPGGFGALIDEIEAARPKIVLISRLQNVRHRAELEAWVDRHYVKMDVPWLNRVYIRKEGD